MTDELLAIGRDDDVPRGVVRCRERLGSVVQPADQRADSAKFDERQRRELEGDRARDVLDDLTAVLVVAERARRSVESGGREVVEQRVHARGGLRRRLAHGPTDADDAPGHVATRELLLPDLGVHAASLTPRTRLRGA